MVLPTTARAAVAAVCGAFLAGAGQLGVVYGLGILRWDRDFAGGQADLWAVQLTWVAWIAAISVVAGAVTGVDVALRNVRPGDRKRRLTVPGKQDQRAAVADAPTRRAGRPRGLGVRVVSALAAAIGGAVTVPLVWLPARFAHPPTPTSPGLTAGLIALVALVPGILAAVAVVSVAPVAGDVAATVAWAGLAVLASVLWSVSRGDLVIAPRLGLVGHGQTVHPTAVYPVMLGAVVMITIAVAGAARWAGRPKLTVATCGVAGPLLVALAYLIAGPGSGEVQRVPYTAAVLSVPVAALVSVAVALARRPVRATPAAEGEPAAGEPTTVEPAAELATAGSTDGAVTLPIPASAPTRTTTAVAPISPVPTSPVPAARRAPGATPAPTPTAAGTEPDAGTPRPKTRRGRAKRGGAESQPSAQESEHIDWVRGLSTEDQQNPRRVPGPRHASPTEEPPSRGRSGRRGVLGLDNDDD